MSDLPEFDRIVLAPDEFLLIRPKDEDWQLTPEQVERLQAGLPKGLRERVLVFDPSLEVTVVKP